jgi:hypothetical protein
MRRVTTDPGALILPCVSETADLATNFLLDLTDEAPKGCNMFERHSAAKRLPHHLVLYKILAGEQLVGLTGTL